MCEATLWDMEFRVSGDNLFTINSFNVLFNKLNVTLEQTTAVDH